MDPTIITALIGAFATIAAAAIGVLSTRSKEKTNADLKKEITRLQKVAICQPMLSPEDYGITIEIPKEYASVGQIFNVSGTYKNLPDGHVIWIATFGSHKSTNNQMRRHYWPQEPATTTFSTEGKKWNCKVQDIGGKTPGETKEFLVLVAGPDGQALFKYFKKAGSETEKWIPITYLTSDVVECTVGKVTFQP